MSRKLRRMAITPFEAEMAAHRVKNEAANKGGDAVGKKCGDGLSARRFLRG